MHGSIQFNINERMSAESSNSPIQSDTRFRKATEADLPRILAITKEVVTLLNAEGNFQWNHTYPLESDFRRDVNEDCLWVAVDTETDEVFAYMAITTDQPTEYNEVGLDTSIECTVPHRLAVLPTSRNRGTAQKFMSFAEEVAKQRGHTIIRVDTNVVNHRMNHVFRKLGYKLFGDVSFAAKGEEYSDMRFNCYEKAL